MTPKDRTELTRLITDTIELHAEGEPDMLARRVVEAIETKGWTVSSGMIPIFDPANKGRIVVGYRGPPPVELTRRPARDG